MSEPCEHVPEAQDVAPSANGCEDCLRIGASWVHLRICMSCGHVGCCDSSEHKHATAHWHGTEHPLVRSFEPGEDWWWCYADERGFHVPDAAPAPSYTT
jgi:uncharacterized UBP type Zn finger protein